MLDVVTAAVRAMSVAIGTHQIALLYFNEDFLPPATHHLRNRGQLRATHMIKIHRNSMKRAFAVQAWRGFDL
jgi:hypothetical protein